MTVTAFVSHRVIGGIVHHRRSTSARCLFLLRGFLADYGTIYLLFSALATPMLVAPKALGYVAARWNRRGPRLLRILEA